VQGLVYGYGREVPEGIRESTTQNPDLDEITRSSTEVYSNYVGESHLLNLDVLYTYKDRIWVEPGQDLWSQSCKLEGVEEKIRPTKHVQELRRLVLMEYVSSYDDAGVQLFIHNAYTLICWNREGWTSTEPETWSCFIPDTCLQCLACEQSLHCQEFGGNPSREQMIYTARFVCTPGLVH
jgi:hypothetical protein